MIKQKWRGMHLHHLTKYCYVSRLLIWEYRYVIPVGWWPWTFGSWPILPCYLRRRCMWEFLQYVNALNTPLYSIETASFSFIHCKYSHYTHDNRFIKQQYKCIIWFAICSASIAIRISRISPIQRSIELLQLDAFRLLPCKLLLTDNNGVN